MTTSSARTPAPSYVRTPAAGFLNSLSVDRPLVMYDIIGSIAHAEMLGTVGIVSTAESKALVTGLRQVAREVSSGTFGWRDDLEDVHTNVEVRLTEIVGAVGGKLHTARSRNDQVALDERLYLRAALLGIGNGLVGLEEALLTRATAETDSPMPGYTHLQRAQPVTVAHWLLAHFWRFERDIDRILATARRANVSPLGAGALAGSTLPIDPAQVATRLGFDRSFENSIDAVSDRDPLAETLFDLALLSVHASALGEEVVLFASTEFGFLERTAALGSGSSLMPQKRNPDVAELIRGKAGRTIGNLVSLLTTLKGLPLAYDRDLQEDKAPVLDSVATVGAIVESLTALVVQLRFDAGRLAEATSDPALYATDRVEQLVAEGVPFREAHARIGQSYADRGAPGPTVLESNPVEAVRRRSSPGAPAPSAVAHQCLTARTRLVAHRASLSSLGRTVELAEELLNEEKR
ncbi:MAG: argininosuccinate lyase [Thermoplasmata archaeon]|nr:argininosuccinate lyase [Thermoplasmata archaeon]